MPLAVPRVPDALVRAAGDARVVLVGEATHGTHEFYAIRAEFTKRLVAEKGFDAVVIEGDWPDAQRVNRYVLGTGRDASPDAALGDFTRFPTWMWRNTVVRDFTGWLRNFNAARPARDRVRFYGMDVYSLDRSRREVTRALEGIDARAARGVQRLYACIGSAGEESGPRGETCARNARAAFEIVRAAVAARPKLDAEVRFDVTQNARVVKNAVAYDEAQYILGASSWNVRDTHMAQVLDAVRVHLGADARVVVWAHNSHVGDARATQMGVQGELTVGQLMRERHGANAFLVGFTTHTGTVTAAPRWGEAPELMHVRPSLPGSIERIFHEVGLPSFLLTLRGSNVRDVQEERLQRAIGVLYLPASERVSHYFGSRLAKQFDAVMHVDVTRAVEPLERSSTWRSKRVSLVPSHAAVTGSEHGE